MDFFEESGIVAREGEELHTNGGSAAAECGSIKECFAERHVEQVSKRSLCWGLADGSHVTEVCVTRK